MHCQARLWFLCSLVVFFAPLPPFFIPRNSLAAQDSIPASIPRLDSCLYASPDSHELLLRRGRLHLAAGDLDTAKEDFSKALNSISPGIKARAHVGLGHIQIRNPRKTLQAAKHYRQAIKLDPTCFDFLYNLAHVGFSFSGLAGKQVAGEALARLICRDPLYENAYRVWRDLALDKRKKEIREVDKRLEVFLEDYPDSASWWVDLARDRFYLGETRLALETLEEMARANPDYISADIPLLRARCYLEAGNTKDFHANYQQALLNAKSTGDFTRLFRQVEPLFSPAAYLAWEGCHTRSSRADFFSQFWGTLKPDPLATVNPRLATHYSRLRLAEKDHKLQLPNIPYQPSLAMSFPQKIQYLFRQGQKKKKINRGSWSQGFPVNIENPLKFWCLGYSGSLYDYTKSIPGMLSKTLELIQMQYDIDVDVSHSGILSYARFRSASQGNLEVELYHGGISGSGPKPKAEIAVFDLAWNELERKQSTVFPAVGYPEKKRWLAVHRLDLEPGTYWFGVRTSTAEGVKWIERGLMNLRGFNKEKLVLSAIVLGSLPAEGSATYSRKDIAILPRPSLKFKQGEIISVFLEIYNLERRQSGSRGFTEEVRVTLVEDDMEKKRDFAGGTAIRRSLDPDKSSSSLNHRFERAPETDSGPVAEFFSIDTSQLRPGNYRMVVKIIDNGSGSSNEASCIFELGE